MTEEQIDFTRQFLVYGNLTLLTWMLLAFLGTWLYNQILGYVVLVLTAMSIYLILRRLGCSSCYYCKACTKGFGRLAGAFFGTGFTKQNSVGNRIGFVGFIYFLLAPLPAALLVVSTIHVFSLAKILVLVCLIPIAAYSFASWFRKPAAKLPSAVPAS